MTASNAILALVLGYYGIKLFGLYAVASAGMACSELGKCRPGIEELPVILTHLGPVFAYLVAGGIRIVEKIHKRDPIPLGRALRATLFTHLIASVISMVFEFAIAPSNPALFSYYDSLGAKAYRLFWSVFPIALTIILILKWRFLFVGKRTYALNTVRARPPG